MSSQNSLFRQQQHLYRSAHFLTKAKLPTLYTPPSNDGAIKGHKRRTSEDEEMSIEDISIDTKQQLFTRNDKVLHTTKRMRESIKKEFPISKLLATLDKDKLIDLINDLVDSNPQLKTKVDSVIPAPTTQSISLVIANLEKKFTDSFPCSKAMEYDDYTYTSVKSALVDLVNALVEYAVHFTTSPNEYPTTLFSYLHYATCVAHRLPVWNNQTHNQIKRDLYLELLKYWKEAILIASSKVQQGRIFGEEVVTEWAKELVQHDTETQGQFSEVLQLFKEKLGWIIGVDA